MRLIPTRIHGILDYLVAAILMFAPWALGFWRNGAESWVPIVCVVLGILEMLAAMLTATVSRVNMRAHTVQRPSR